MRIAVNASLGLVILINTACFAEDNKATESATEQPEIVQIEEENVDRKKIKEPTYMEKLKEKYKDGSMDDYVQKLFRGR